MLSLIAALLLTAPSGQLDSGISLTDARGKSHSILKTGQQSVFLFLGHDCPISNKYSPEINRIIAEYGKKFAFFIVYADPGVRSGVVRKHASDFGYRCPSLLDPKHKLVKRAGVTVTPEAAVIDKAGRLAYRGRIDDTYIDFGKRRDAPSKRDLRAALESVLKGKKANPAITRAIGCFIPGRV